MKTLRALAFATIGMAAILPAYLRAMTVSGPSDAPSLLVGDRVLVNLAAYRLMLPYTSVSLWEHSAPARGDMAMFHVPNRGVRGFKRVIGVPGDTVELRENSVIVNGEPLTQRALDRSRFVEWVSSRHELGETVALEAGRYFVTYTQGASPVRTMPPVRVQAGHYFLLGDCRDDSNDSRVFGAVERSGIAGRLAMHLTSDRPREMFPAW